MNTNVRTWVDGHVGRIQLNRPTALNALTHSMVTDIHSALDGWATDGSIKSVVVTGSGDRAFCAGGDIVSIHQDAIANTPPHETASAKFWRDEYALNLAIARYPKPYVPIMSGIVLGGGVGLSAHGSHRIVTDSTSVGMPETGIGFIPDVGGTWLLSHASGELGTYLGLTAGSIGPGDAILASFADHYIPQADIDSFLEMLTAEDLDSAIDRFSRPAPTAPLAQDTDWINQCFAKDEAAGIVASLRASAEPKAQKAADRIERNSPTAVAVTLKAIRAARHLDGLAAALSVEYQLVCNFLDNPDFAEGIRAAVIDKDRSPNWQPNSLSAVSDVVVDQYFIPSGNRQVPNLTEGDPA